MDLELFDRVEAANAPENAVDNIRRQESPRFAIEVERSLLLKSLANVQTIVERSNIIPILANVKLHANDEVLELTATNNDLAITDKVAVKPIHGGAVTVPAHTLYDIVRKLPDGVVRLITDEAKPGRLDIICGSCQFSLPFLSAENFPAVEYGTMTHKFQMNVADLISLFDKNRNFISTEETRYNLNGVYFHTIENQDKTVLRAVAIDGHRLSRIEIPLPEGASSMPGIIIPRKTVLEARKLLDNASSTVEIELSATKIKFTYDNIKLIAKLIDGSFPNYDILIPYTNERKIQINSKQFADAVDRVSIVTFEKLRAIKFSAHNNALTLSAVDEVNGSAVEKLEINYSDKSLDIGFNSRYLLDVMNVIKGDTVEFAFGEDDAPVIIRDFLDDSSIYVVMPLLVK